MALRMLERQYEDLPPIVDSLISLPVPSLRKTLFKYHEENITVRFTPKVRDRSAGYISSQDRTYFVFVDEKLDIDILRGEVIKTIIHLDLETNRRYPESRAKREAEEFEREYLLRAMRV